MIRTRYILNIALLLLMGAATMHAQTIKGKIYGGGNLAQVEGSTTINIKSGEITIKEVDGAEDGNIYGGGYGASAVLTGNTTINVTGGTIAKDVYGGGALANVTGSTEVNIKGGTVTQDVYGGGALANVVKDLEHELLGNTTVNLTGGTIRNSYGGGLGQLADAGAGKVAVEAIVNGDATVTLGKLQDKADPSDPDVYTSSKVNGSIFGANNVNGTPQGHVKVHVLKTTSRDQANRNTTGTAESFDVMAVYGGGNLAAYVPSDETLADAEKNFAEVLIENCDNSIAYVYGGGNAAPVPATKVTIKGANAIDNAFAGGNGAGQSTDPSAANYNPGADIGYLEYTRNDPEKEYGTGVATIEIMGGTIHHVYGGSNTLGYIKDHAVVNVEADGTTCRMDVTELYGGGKMAPGKAATINITCTGEGKIDNVYGGAHMADLVGDITLNIHGGNIGNAFGGNNESGLIRGAVKVVVDWDDECTNNSLNNVYGGGNVAHYSVYGYNNDGTSKQKADDNPRLFEDPVIEIRNCTISYNVFGGGLGETAVVTGNPQVKIGIFEGEEHQNTTDHHVLINESVYGGGSQAAVEGYTDVNINSGGTTLSKKVEIKGDVFGGGMSAPVSEHTNVYIKGSTVDGYVYGGGSQGTVGTADRAVNNQDYTKVIVEQSEVKQDVFGGGLGAQVTGNTAVWIKGTDCFIHGSVLGGGFGGDVTGDTHVQIGARDVNGDGEDDDLYPESLLSGGN